MELFSNTEYDYVLLNQLLIAAGIISILCFIISVVNKNYSQVDRLWSILPSIYTLWILFYSRIKDGEFSTKLFLTNFIVNLWSIRLTYNFYRKGGYSVGNEDYRWEYVKTFIPNRVLFEIFNLTFISFYQNYLILFFALPDYFVYLNRNKSFSFLEIAFIGLFLFFLLIEGVADNQQWRFQQEKKKLKETNEIEFFEEYKSGFIQSGLFQYSRHPNFFSEIMIWWCFYLNISFF